MNEQMHPTYCGMFNLGDGVALEVAVDHTAPTAPLLHITYTCPDNRGPGRRGLYETSLSITCDTEEPGLVDLRPDPAFGEPVIGLPSFCEGRGVLGPAARALAYVEHEEGRDLWTVVHRQRRLWRAGFLGLDCSTDGMRLLGLVDG